MFDIGSNLELSWIWTYQKLLIKFEQNCDCNQKCYYSNTWNIILFEFYSSDVNAHTYVYQPELSLRRMTIEALPSEEGYLQNIKDMHEYRPNLGMLLTIGCYTITYWNVVSYAAKNKSMNSLIILKKYDFWQSLTLCMTRSEDKP